MSEREQKHYWPRIEEREDGFVVMIGPEVVAGPFATEDEADDSLANIEGGVEATLRS
jgi:hypothetical protein